MSRKVLIILQKIAVVSDPGIWYDGGRQKKWERYCCV